MDGLNGNPIKMDDLGVPLFLETPIYSFFQTKELGKQHNRCVKFV